MITRSQSNPESDSDKNPVINNGDKDDFKTPMNVRQPSPPTCNTPTSSLSDIAVRARKLLESSVSKGIYICSICRKSKSTDSNNGNDIHETLSSKLEKATEVFTDCVAKVESFSAHLPENSIVNSLETKLKVLQNSISNLAEKIQVIEQSIANHQVSMDLLSRTFVNSNNNDCNASLHHTATKTNKPFTIDHYHNRIINGIPKPENNPTKCTSDIKQKFLSPEIRSSVTEFLDSYSDYSEKGSRKVAIFGQPPSTYGTREHKKIASIPPTLNAVINLVHEHFNISEDSKINSVVICKYKSNSSHLPKQ